MNKILLAGHESIDERLACKTNYPLPHRRQFDFISGGHTEMHCEESGDRHGPPGSETCSLGILHSQRSIL